MTITRQEVHFEDKWNVEALYPSFKEWEKEFTTLTKSTSPALFEQIHAFQGTLSKSVEQVKNTLDTILSIERSLRKLYTYAHLRNDENLSDDEAKKNFGIITALYHQFSSEISWLEPELLALPESTIRTYLEAAELESYRFYLQKIVRQKPHTLSKDEEALLSRAQEALQSTAQTFSVLNNADFVFGSVLDSNHKELPLTHGSYGLYIRSPDRILRKNAFTSLHTHYANFQNTLCELLAGAVKSHVFNAKSRKFSTCLDAALYPKNINRSVYENLISTVRENIHVLHRYMNVRKKALNVDKLHLYDVYVPILSSLNRNYSYAEAENLVIESTAPLGQKYTETLKKGLKIERWVDRFENKNKRSGAYSSGCYDSMPYILMNFKGTLNDVFTLAHEAGHSMHSYLSHKSQPYQYADYEIFVAEVASTFNEELLMNTMLKHATTDQEKAHLINEKIEDIRGTLFRQTMFAEFELLIHTLVESKIPLTPELLKAEYTKLNKFYFGDTVHIDDEIAIEWSRIPHFYYNFYVYQYATGISAALALSERVLKGDKKSVENYVRFLSSGGSNYPIQLLIDAGVDMQKPEPIREAIYRFDNYVTQLEALLNKFSS